MNKSKSTVAAAVVGMGVAGACTGSVAGYFIGSVARGDCGIDCMAMEFGYAFIGLLVGAVIGMLIGALWEAQSE